MDKILHDPKDPKLWELWYIPYYGSCMILSINRCFSLGFHVLGAAVFLSGEQHYGAEDLIMLKPRAPTKP